MSEAGRMDIHISIPGDDDGRPRKLRRLLTLDDLVSWIRLQELDDYTTNGLIEIASRYPTHALPMFRKNINIMINRVRAKRRKEMRSEVDLYPLDPKPLDGEAQNEG